MTTRTIEKSLFLKASPERVWAFLTDKTLLAEWFHPAEHDLTDGKDYALLSKDGSTLCSGTVTEMTPHTRLAYSFTAGPMGGLMTEVTWTLTEVEGGTHLALRHEGFPGSGEAFGLLAAFDAGWDDHLKRMRGIDA